MAKTFNVYLDKGTETQYLGTYHAKTFKESCFLALEENGYSLWNYDKKTNTYMGYPLVEKERENNNNGY